MLVISSCSLLSLGIILIAALGLTESSSSINAKCKFKRNYLPSGGANGLAKCLDGSQPAFYISRPSTPSSNWILYFESGGWCYDPKSCYERSLTALGSSKMLGDCLSDELISKMGYLSNDQRSNLVTYNWNKVFINYCDGGSWSGNGDTQYNGKKLYFRGLHNRNGVINELLTKFGMSQASTVVVSGKSAGALAVLMGVDHIAGLIKSVRRNITVLGLADSGFFMNYDTTVKSIGIKNNDNFSYVGYIDINKRKYAEELDVNTFKNIYSTKMKNIFKMMNLKAGAPKDCLDNYGNSGMIENCVFAENLVRTLKTPTLLLQPTYDSWQLKHVLGSLQTYADGPKDKETTGSVNEFGVNVTRQVLMAIQGSNVAGGSTPVPPVAVFFDYCFHHGYKLSEFRNIRGSLVMFHSRRSSTLKQENKFDVSSSTNLRASNRGVDTINYRSFKESRSTHTANTAFNYWIQSFNLRSGTSDRSGSALKRLAGVHNEPFPCSACCA